VPRPEIEDVAAFGEITRDLLDLRLESASASAIRRGASAISARTIFSLLSSDNTPRARPAATAKTGEHRKLAR